MKLTDHISTIAALVVLGIALVVGVNSGYSSHDHATSHATPHGDDLASVGRAGDAKQVSRTIAVDMSDTMRFTPDAITVKRGETIRFVLNNTGKVAHEFNLGTTAQLQEHAAMMQKMPGMQHAEPNAVSVEPGKTGEVIWQFTQVGAVDIGCLYPGHFAAGMKGQIQVVAE